MIDDMWAELDGENSRDNMHTRKLRKFSPAPKQFPKGLKAAITEVKENLDVILQLFEKKNNLIKKDRLLFSKYSR